MRPVQLLFDEHLPLALQKGLRRRVPGTKTWRVGQPEAPAFGTLDPGLLVWCEEKHAILVSADRRMVAAHFGAHLAGGRRCWGLVVVSSELGQGQVLDELQMICEASEAEDWLDRIEYLPL